MRLALKEEWIAQLDATQISWLRAAHEPYTALTSRVEGLGKQMQEADQRQGDLQSTVESWRDTTRLEVEKLERADQTQFATLERLIASERESHQESLRSVQERLVDDGASMRAWLQEKQADADRLVRQGRDTQTTKVDELERRTHHLQSELAQSKSSQQEGMMQMQKQVAAGRDASADASARSEHMLREKLHEWYEKELRPLSEQNLLLRRSVSSLATGVLRSSKMFGLLPSSEEGSNFRDDKVDAMDLVEWEQSGTSLATRLDKSWIPRTSIKVRTMMDMLGKKADTNTVQMIQMAVRDLDLRLTQLARAAEGSAAEIAAVFRPAAPAAHGSALPRTESWQRTLLEDTHSAPGHAFD